MRKRKYSLIRDILAAIDPIPTAPFPTPEKDRDAWSPFEDEEPEQKQSGAGTDEHTRRRAG